MRVVAYVYAQLVQQVFVASVSIWVECDFVFHNKYIKSSGTHIISALNDINVNEYPNYPICIVAIQASEMGSVQTKNCATVFFSGVLKLLGWGFLLYTPTTATTLSKTECLC